MALYVKSGDGAARLAGVHGQLFFAAVVVDQVYSAWGIDECWITAGIDGQHMDGSLHYNGLALDFRHNNVPEDKRPNILGDVKKRLGDDYDFVVEGTHFHLEFQPHKAYTA